MMSVWKTLSAINVNEHTEKKGNLTYLSWAWAWSALMEHYPDSSYTYGPPFLRTVLVKSMYRSQ